MIRYIKATLNEAEQVYSIVQKTIKAVYPDYYPLEVVDFFCNLHSKEKIISDIENGYVSVLKIDEKIVAWLHDVIEDTDVTYEDLRKDGLVEKVEDYE